MKFAVVDLMLLRRVAGGGEVRVLDIYDTEEEAKAVTRPSVIVRIKDGEQADETVEKARTGA